MILVEESKIPIDVYLIFRSEVLALTKDLQQTMNCM